MLKNTNIIENMWIPLRDGRRLAAKLWLPHDDAPAPAILEYLPYRKRDGTAPRDETTHPVFADAGYACIRVDISGTGDSEGAFDDEYSEQELSDGEEILEWVANQNWCDGKIGMIGISWGGFNGLQLAYRQPEALKAIVTVASTTDRYADDIHYMDGCMLTDNFNWSCQMFAYLSRPADPLLRDDWREDWIKRIEEVPFMAADWMRHPNRDEFWKHGSVCEDWSKIQVPVLAITGWADSYINTPPALVKNLSSPTKAIIGPWEHRYAHISKIDPADFHSEVIGWFDRWLKGEQNGAEDLPDYRTFMQEHSNPSPKNTPRKGRWIAEHKWPSPNMTQKNLYLCPGSLTDTMVAGKQVITTPAHVGTQAGYYCPGMRIDNELAGDQTNDDEMSVCFDTLPLSKPMELMGRCSLKISFTVDKPVAQICARLCDVSSDNISQRLSYRCFNLNHQDSHETPAMLMPGQEYQAIIELNECAHRLRKGHKLRLALSTSYWPIIWPSPEAASVTINLEKSSFSIPVRNVTDEIDPAAPGKPQDFPALQAEELRAASGTSQSGMQDDGRYLLETFDDYGKTRDPYHRMIVGSHVHQHYSIHPDAPETARQETKWNFTFERNEWSVEINTESVMTCDENNFYLTRKLRAYEGVNKSEVLTKDWSETIPRGLL